MWEKIRVVFTIPELRQEDSASRSALLAVYRVGWQIPLPIVDQATMTAFFKRDQRHGPAVLSKWPCSAPAQLNQITIFGLGIMPYISASIIFQLLGSVWGPLERLQKEGESGRKKINEYTRYATVVLVHRPKLGLRGLSDQAMAWCTTRFSIDGAADASAGSSSP